MRDLVISSAPFATQNMARAEDIAPPLAFLASPDNRFTVGQVPFCDGGCDLLLRGDDVPASSPQAADPG